MQQATASETPTAGGNAKAAATAIEAAPAAVLEERKPKPLEDITPAELVDMPQYWYDDRLANGDGGLVDKLSLKAGKALKAMMFDTEEFTFEAKGKKMQDSGSAVGGEGGVQTSLRAFPEKCW